MSNWRQWFRDFAGRDGERMSWLLVAVMLVLIILALGSAFIW